MLLASTAKHIRELTTHIAELDKRGKSTKAGGGAIARKLAEIAFTLVASNRPWSDDKAQTGLSKGHAMAEATG